MIKNNKTRLIISSVIILLPMLFGLLVYDKLPEQMATHWGADGSANGWSSTAFAVFALPIFLLIMHLVCLLITSRDRSNDGQNQKALGLVFWIIPITSLLTNGMVYATAFGMTLGISLIIPMFLGLMFIVIGNYMPKCKQNFTLGVKIRPTLESEANWNATHRVTGKVWFFGGVIMLFFSLLPTEIMIPAVLVLMLPLIIIPIAYSYSFRKKELREGVELKPLKVGKGHKAYVAVSVVVTIVILILCAVIMFTGDVKMTCGDSSFTVDSIYYSSLTVDYSEITDIQYRDDIKFGVRTHGFASARLLIGSFENNEFGVYTLYAYTSSDECIVITAGGKTLVVAGKNNKETLKMYEELLTKLIRED